LSVLHAFSGRNHDHSETGKERGTSSNDYAKTASIAVNYTDGHWRVSYALLRKIVGI
jgi:hypothetical protein